MRRFAFVAAALAAAFAVLVPESGAQSLTSCSTSGQNRYVYDVMRAMYFWDTQLPTLNPTSFASPEALLDALRYRPLDERYSYIGMREAEESFYSDSQFIGFGFSNGYDGVGLRILQVFPDSPAGEAGLVRGGRITAIDGQSVTALVNSGTLDSALGPPTQGFTMRFRYERPDGNVVDAMMTKRPVTIPTVSLVNLYVVDGRKVGYVFFRNFVTPSRAALDDAFNALRDAGANELVLDLRYNGGGLVSIAQHLSSLIGGSRLQGQTFAEYFHNARNSFRNEVTRFEAKPNALPLQRLVVITTGASASASELVINSLRPFMPVITVGQASYGKPVGQYGFTMCDKVIYPVSFTLRNARGEGDYFNGIAADCPAGDDPNYQLGDAKEASLAEALTIIRTGRCGGGTAKAGPERAREPLLELLPARGGLEQLIGAR